MKTLRKKGGILINMKWHCSSDGRRNYNVSGKEGREREEPSSSGRQ